VLIDYLVNAVNTRIIYVSQALMSNCDIRVTACFAGVSKTGYAYFSVT